MTGGVEPMPEPKTGPAVQEVEVEVPGREKSCNRPSERTATAYRVPREEDV
jgi:hypothetical protein